MVTLLIALAAQVASTSVAEAARGLSDIPNLSVAYYDVQGRRPEAIRRSIERLGPTDPSGKGRVHALTTWEYQWGWPRGPGGCDLAEAEVSYTIEVLLPRPAEYDLLPKHERERWDRYMSGLVAHERNHALIVAGGARELERAIKSAEDCEAASMAAKRVMEGLAAANREYDRKTRHGIAEGIIY
jgi:predicted secreted Zn-dependent protease